MISELESQSKRKLANLQINDLVNLETDIIIKYKIDGKVTSIPFYKKHLHIYSNSNSGETLVNFLKFFLATDKEIEILRIFHLKKRFFKREDFRIKILERRIYGAKELSYVKIINTITNVIFEDWIERHQLSSIFLLNNLICWENEGKDVNF